MPTDDLRIEVFYERHPDGTYFIRSDSIPGFRLQGPDIAALQRDLNPVVADLLLQNMQIEVDPKSIHWVPSPEEVKQQLQQPSFEGRVTYFAKIKTAA